MAQAQSSADSGTADANDTVVTAQKRSERLIDVPVSITAVSAETLAIAGQDSLASLNKLVPGLYITQPVYFLSPTIRGIGSTLSVSSESNIAIYIDGVYQPAQGSSVFDLASISGVEVLKGPQGTLFGRNATGGAILVKTRDPSFTDMAANFELSYARFDEVRAGGYVSVPINDKIAVNAAVSYRYTNGYVRDVRTDQILNEGRSFVARGKVRLAPADGVDVILTASHNSFDDPTASIYQNLNGRSQFAAVPGSGPLATDRYHVSHDVIDVVRTKANEYTARINVDTGLGTLSSITALKRDYLFSTNDADNSYLNVFRVDFDFRGRTFTQEVNLTSPSDQQFTYVIGAFYYHNHKFYDLFQYNRADYLFSDNKANAIAGYADGTLNLGNLAIIGGIRYSSEKRRQDNGLLPGPLVPRPGSRSLEARDNSWTPRLSLRYAIGPRSNVYAIYSRGFKAGVFDGTSLTNPGVKPETVDAFEVGLKSAGRRFTFNASGYYYLYHDIQANALLITNGVALNSLVNAAKARIHGLELDGSYMVSDALSVRATFGYTNGQYKSFPGAPAYRPLANGGNAAIFVDASGNPTVRTPKVQASAQIDYTIPLGERAITFSLSHSYQGRVYYDFDSQLSQGPVFVVDGSATLKLSDQFKVAVFGRNITDKVYATSKGFSTFGTNITFAKPATYGVTLSYAFQ
jgi:iron complex outermembrane receptor protein